MKRSKGEEGALVARLISHFYFLISKKMSDFKRLERLAKSLIPRIPRDEDRQYTLEDARMMLTDLGLQMSPAVLRFLTEDDNKLDDFLMNVYQLEQKFRRKVITDFATLAPDLDPKVYVEDGKAGFSVTRKGKEIVFAEYDLPANKNE